MVFFAVLVYSVVLLAGVVVWVAMGGGLGALAVVMVLGAVIVSSLLSAAVVLCVVVNLVARACKALQPRNSAGFF